MWAIANLVYKDMGGKDQDKDIRIDQIIALTQYDKNFISVKMSNGFSFEVPAKVGLGLSKLWEAIGNGEQENKGVHKFTVN